MREMLGQQGHPAAAEDARPAPACFSFTGADPRVVIVNINAHTVHLDAETLRALSPIDSPEAPRADTEARP